MTIKKIVHTEYRNEDGFEFSLEPIEDTIDLKKKNGGFEAKYLTHDETPMSPDEWADDALFLVHYHRDFWIERKDQITKDALADFYRGEHIEEEKDYHIFPVSALIHSGVSLSLGRRNFMEDPGGWDTSRVGACLASKKEWDDEKKAEKACEGLVDEWNKYLMGDVYCLVKDELDAKKNVVNTSSVCGYAGYDEALEELKDFRGE